MHFQMSESGTAELCGMLVRDFLTNKEELVVHSEPPVELIGFRRRPDWDLKYPSYCH